MKITNSTPVAPIGAIDNIGNLKTFLTKDCGMDAASVEALIAHATGESLLSCLRTNGLYSRTSSPASNQGRFRSSLATAMLTLVRATMAPISEALAEEEEKQTAAEMEKAIAAWEKGGRKGRCPGQRNNPINAMIRAAYSASITETRDAMNIQGRGRVRTELIRSYHEAIVKTFTHKLKALVKSGNELPDTIDNLVNEFVGPLDEESIATHEIELAIREAVRNAYAAGRDAIGAQARGVIPNEDVAAYNKTVKATFKDSLRAIKEEFGSLPESMDSLMETRLNLFVAAEDEEKKDKPKGKTTPKPTVGKKHVPAPPKDDADPEAVSGDVETETEVDSATDEADANAEVEAALAAQSGDK